MNLTANRSKKFWSKEEHLKRPILYCCFLLPVTLLFISYDAAQADFLSTPQLASSGIAATELARNTESGSQNHLFLVGVYLNGRDRGAMNVLLDNGEIWIPWNDFLELSGLQVSEEQNDTVMLRTTIGDIRLATTTLRLFGGKSYISFKMLEEQFRVFPSFDQSLFAIKLQITWSPAKSTPPARAVLKADVNGPATSLAFIHGTYQYNNDLQNPASQELELLSGGRVLDGIWNIDMQGDPSRNMDLTTYHWTSINTHTAFRLGTGQTDFPTLLSTGTFTGAQLGWSNTDITPYFDQPLSSSLNAFMIFNSSQLRNIDGSGPAGGIAELRFNGKAVARQLIRLDGRFSFPNVQMGLDFRKTEVYVYTRSILEKPSAILDYSQSIASRALESGKILASGGIGRDGNPLLQQNNADSGRPTTYGHIQYGVNHWLTAETAIQKRGSGHGPDGLAGAVFSLGSSWNASAYAASSNAHLGTELSLEHRGERSSLSLSSSRYEQNFLSDEQPSIKRQLLNFSWSPFNNMNLLLLGRREKSEETNISFLRPGGSIFFRNGFRFSVTPEYEAFPEYRYEINYYATTFWWTAVYNTETIDTTVSWQFSDRTNVRLFNQYSVSNHANATSAYLDWYTTSARRSLIQFVASHKGNRTGFSLAYHRAADAGLDFSLAYLYQMNNTLMLDIDQAVQENPVSKHLFMCTLSLDFGWSGKRLQPVNRWTISPMRGGIAGSLDADEDSGLQKSQIQDIGILVNGYRMPQNQQDGNYFVGNLKPGLYKVSVDPAKLPIQFVPDKESSIVEVKGSGITNVNIPVHAEYGIAGQLFDLSGKGVANGTLVLTDSKNNTVAMVSTNEFGYYRADGLRSGQYLLKPVSVTGQPIENADPKTVIIKNDYLFDVNVTVNIPAVTQKKAEAEGEKSANQENPG